MNYQTFAIMTLGCKVNTYESESMINQLTSQGLVQVAFTQIADIYIINTCSVTNTADLKSRNMIRRAHKVNPNALILVAGCYSQTASQTIKSELPVDIIIGNKYKNRIYFLISEFEKTHQQIVKVDNLLIEKAFETLENPAFSDRTRAFIKIQDGCNFMCSYCSIPFTRGRQRSASHISVLKQIRQFINEGYKELVLTGVNTAGYNDGECDFYALLKLINAEAGNFRIRISSVEPFQITPEIITLICSNSQRFCNHWHICLQSGSDEVLEAMHRKYTTSDFLTLVKQIRQHQPLVSISTDYIVGFPTETEQAHETSLAYLAQLQLSFSHIFTYSKRNQTVASKFPDLHGSIKHARFVSVENLQKTLTKKYLEQFIGRSITALFETYENGVYAGKSSEYCDILLKSDNSNLLNQFINLKVEKVINYHLICTIIE